MEKDNLTTLKLGRLKAKQVGIFTIFYVVLL